MGIFLAGKRPPNSGELAEAAEEGFERVELYLERTHLDAFEETYRVCREAPVEVVSVHTPHVPPNDVEYLRRTSELASKLNSFLVVHSTKMTLLEIPAVLDAINADVDVGFENSIGHSEFHLANAILDAGHDLVLDTAHLYTAEKQYLDSMEYLLTKYADQIPVVHLCDGFPMRDGLPFGSGEMAITEITSLIETKLGDGIVVLEVPTEKQKEALNVYNSSKQ